MIQCAVRNYRITEVAIPTRYENDSSSINFLKSVKYGARIVKEIIRYKLHKYKIRKDPRFE